MALPVALATLLAGCGDGNNVRDPGSYYPVKGKITLPDGKPLAATTVVFMGPVTGTTKTESDGTFTFKGTKDGLPAGDYKVRLEIAESKGKIKGASLPFPAKYLDEETTDLTATVTSGGPNDFDLKLTPGKNAPGKAAGGGRPGK